VDGAHTPLHLAARKPELPMLALLIRKGADPLLINAQNRNPLQQLSVQAFPPFSSQANPSDGVSGAAAFFFAGLRNYLHSSALSDVTLKIDSGETFPAHRIILCAHSAMFRALLDASRFAEKDAALVPISDISAPTMRLLLNYLYTGDCAFVKEDLATGVELMQAAARCLVDPLRDHCERLLALRLNVHTVVGLYRAAVTCEANVLLGACQHFLLSQYGAVYTQLSNDHHPDAATTLSTRHGTLLHVFDTANARERTSMNSNLRSIEFLTAKRR